MSQDDPCLSPFWIQQLWSVFKPKHLVQLLCLYLFTKCLNYTAAYLFATCWQILCIRGSSWPFNIFYDTHARLENPTWWFVNKEATWLQASHDWGTGDKNAIIASSGVIYWKVCLTSDFTSESKQLQYNNCVNPSYDSNLPWADSAARFRAPVLA